MKNNMIRESWDAVNPTSEQKQRMRAALEAHMEASGYEVPKKEAPRQKIVEFEDLELFDFTLPADPYGKKQTKKEEKKAKIEKPRQEYVVKSKKTSRWSIVSTVIAASLMVLLTLSLCLAMLTRGQGEPHQAASPTAPDYENGVPETVVLHPDTLQAPDTGVPLYNQVLQKYVDAINQNWSQQKYLDADISAHIFDDNAQDALGWCLMDVDSNGQEELLISDGEKLYDGYTVTGNALAHFLTANDEDEYQLCEDGVIYCFSIVDGKTFWTFYKLADGFAMQEIQTVVYDNSSSTYYAGQTESSVEPITKDDAGNLIVSTYPRIKVPVTLFQTGEEELPEEYRALVDQYVQAIEEDWDMAKCSEAGISILVSYITTLDDLGYALQDLDGDGFEELIITDGNMVYDVYTRFQSTDRQLTHVIISFERINYYLSNEGVLVREGFGSAYAGEYQFCRMENGAEYAVERLEYEYGQDASQEASPEWKHYDPGNLSTPVSVTEDEANAIIDSYPHIFIPHTTFAGEKRTLEYSEELMELMPFYAAAIPEAYERYGKAEEKTFCFYDIDDDGKEELLLGGGNTIYKILQPKRGSGENISIYGPGGETGYVYLCEGNVLRLDSMLNSYLFFKLNDPDGSAANEYEELDHIFYAPDTDRWYEGGSGINTPLDDETAWAIFDKYPQVNLNWKPISEFPAEVGEIPVYGTALFEHVFMAVATGKVSNRLEDVTALIDGLDFTWRIDEGILECIDHNAQHGTLIGYLTNQNGYEEIFDLTYVNKYGENEEDCRKATVAMLEGEDKAYYIGTDTVIYVGAEIEDTNDFRKFVFGDDDSLMLKVLTTQFAVAYFSNDEIYLEDAVSLDCTQQDWYTGGFTSFRDFGEIRGLPLEEPWDGSPVCLSLPFVDSRDTDSYTYLTLEFVKENGFWKVSFYGLEK